MKTGNWINFSYQGEHLSGKVLKVYTQIGGEFHNQKMIVIRLDNVEGLFQQTTINCLLEEVNLI
jgi:hypothetical protein